MWSRREFLSTVAAGIAVPASSRAWVPAQEEIKTVLNGPVGLQMWSLREYLPKDLPGTLAKVRAMGFREVEGAGLWNHTVADLKGALDGAGLRCQSAHMGFERLRDDAPGAFAEAKALGASWVVCPWIPHEKEFTREDALKSAETFNTFGSAAEAAGLRFAYHCHGYEMLPSPEGTRFETLAQNTDSKRVLFQVDVFHALHGGTNPVDLINRYASVLSQ
jgi:sugar phosphate isomerase/epimerase